MQKFTYSVVYVVLWLIEMAILARFILKLLGANPANQYVAFAYSAGAVFAGPFMNIFGIITENGIIVEPSLLLAMVFYAVVGFLLISLLDMVARRYPTRFS